MSESPPSNVLPFAPPQEEVEDPHPVELEPTGTLSEAQRVALRNAARRLPLPPAELPPSLARLVKPTKLTKQIYEDVFELIGGIPALALWADSNRTEFYRIHGKMLGGELGQGTEPIRLLVAHYMADAPPPTPINAPRPAIDVTPVAE